MVLYKSYRIFSYYLIYLLQQPDEVGTVGFFFSFADNVIEVKRG